MNYPDWYLGWRHEAVHQLQEKTARLRAEFQLNSWPRYDYDLDAGTLIFSEDGIPKVIAEIQIAGSTSQRAGDWLWAWANSYLPPRLVIDSKIVRVFGAERDIPELKDANIRGDDISSVGWELTAVMVRVVDAVGAYRPPRDEGGGLYLVYKSVKWAI